MEAPRDAALLSAIEEVEQLAVHDQYPDRAPPEHRIEIVESRLEQLGVAFRQGQGGRFFDRGGHCLNWLGGDCWRWIRLATVE